MSALLELNDLNKSYKGSGKSGDLHVLKDISLQIFPGELIAIMGKSGSGKSTLLNIIGCVDNFDSGKYLFDEKQIRSLKDTALSKIRGKDICFIFQDFALIEEESVVENIKTTLYFDRSVSFLKMRRMAVEAAKKVGIEDILTKKVNRLSGGQKQRVAIARAIVNRPKLILADEPTGSLDSATAQSILDMLKDIHSQGTTILIVTHDRDIARQCDRTLYIEDGRIIDTVSK